MPWFKPLFRSTLLLVALAPLAAAVEGEARLLRFPDIHAERIVFVHGGDLWLVPAEGGVARRLTTDEGLELFPKFSPDGRRIAFSAEYGGNRQVWIMPAEGGRPTQLTFYNDVGRMPPRGGFDYQVLDWTPDGRHVVVRANRLPWGERMGRPYLVPADGGMERPLEIPEGGGGSLSPDGTKFVYTPIDREFRTWKRYRGGRAQDVWVYDLEAHSSNKLTDWIGTDNQPVWVGDTIYFTSDREGGRLQLFAIDPAGGPAERLTSHRDFDVLWPSGGPRQIVYESGGELWRFDPAVGSSTQVHVRIAGDDLYRVPHFENVRELIQSAELSRSGQRALMDARGELFTVPAEHGSARNLTGTPGVREHSPAWSPDGTRIAYFGDATGEYELYLRAQDGAGEPRRVTEGLRTWPFPPVWSPDGKRVAFGDSDSRLRLVDVETGRLTDVDRGDHSFITRYRFSPDGKWLVYDKVGDTRFASLWVWSLDERRPQRLTDGRTNDYGAAWDPKGRYLWFLSDRDYNLTFSGYEFDYLYTNPTRVYAASLNDEVPALRRPQSDEEKPGDDEAAEEKKGDEKEKDAKTEEKPVTVTIDVEGFGDRVVALPGDSGVYRSLHGVDEGVLFVEGEDDEQAVKRFLIEDEKVETILEGVGDYAVSGDQKKILYHKGDDWGIVELKAEASTDEGRLDLGTMTTKVLPADEWRQIFVDAWRITRDWFYDRGMHGVDWQAMRELYEPLVAHVAHRADLDYILGEMGSELAAGHYYVNWGDMPEPERVDNGLLGAEIERHESGHWRVAHVFPGENWHEEFRSPLTVAGVDVEEGDFILAVDNRPGDEVANFWELLENKADRTVSLLVNDRPVEAGARTELVVPIAQETNLRYLDWIEDRRRRVAELSGGRIGYIHVPDTSIAGNRELRKYFYPQAHHDALILDVRYNGGGFIPDRMIELLARTQLSFWARRDQLPFNTPGFAHAGPKVCLINGHSSSGGDAFPYYFRKLGLGPLIGTRTWGGLIGLSGNPGLMDGGSINVPTFRILDTEGNWVIENEGVAPDIEVMDRPELVAQGRDPTLEAAVAWLLDELERNPPRRLEVPEPPRIPR